MQDLQPPILILSNGIFCQISPFQRTIVHNHEHFERIHETIPLHFNIQVALSSKLAYFALLFLLHVVCTVTNVHHRKD